VRAILKYRSVIYTVIAAASKRRMVLSVLNTDAEAVSAEPVIIMIFIQLSSAAWRNGIASDYDLKGSIPTI
jgi:hypothetical protein